jgi:hypothetical protein
MHASVNGLHANGGAYLQLLPKENNDDAEITSKEVDLCHVGLNFNTSRFRAFAAASILPRFVDVNLRAQWTKFIKFHAIQEAATFHEGEPWMQVPFVADTERTGVWMLYPEGAGVAPA